MSLRDIVRKAEELKHNEIIERDREAYLTSKREEVVRYFRYYLDDSTKIIKGFETAFPKIIFGLEGGLRGRFYCKKFGDEHGGGCGWLINNLISDGTRVSIQFVSSVAEPKEIGSKDYAWKNQTLVTIPIESTKVEILNAIDEAMQGFFTIYLLELPWKGVKK